MSRPKVDATAEVIDWIDGNPRRDALLIGEVPMSPSTLSALKSGSYRPSQDFYDQILAVMRKYPKEGPPEAA